MKNAEVCWLVGKDSTLDLRKFLTETNSLYMLLLSNRFGFMAYNCGIVPSNPTSKLFNAVRIVPLLQHIDSTGVKSSIEFNI